MMVRLHGSMRKVPTRPPGARVSTVPESTMWWPLSSSSPPLPVLPPVALMRAPFWKIASPSDEATTWPPLESEPTPLAARLLPEARTVA